MSAGVMGIRRVEVSHIELSNFTATPKWVYYIEVSCGGMDIMSKTLPAHVPPMWREHFNFNFIARDQDGDGLGGALRVSLFGRKATAGESKSQFLGEVSLRLESLAPNHPTDEWLSLRGRGASQEVKGKVRIIVTYVVPDHDPCADDGGDDGGAQVYTQEIEAGAAIEPTPADGSDLQELQREIERLQARIAEKDEILESLRAEVHKPTTTTEEVESLQHQLAEAQTVAWEWKVKAEECEAREVEAQRKALAASTSCSESSGSALLRELQEADGVPVKKQAAASGGDDGEDSKKLRVLKQAYKKLRADYVALQDKNAELTAKAAQEQTYDRHASAVEILKSDREALQKQLAGKDEEMVALKAQTAKVVAKLVEAKETIGKLTQQVNTLKAQAT